MSEKIPIIHGRAELNEYRKKIIKEARKGYVRLEDLTKIMYKGMSALSGDCRVSLVLEEIKKLGGE